ncbi:endonuclease-reverse transcriptase [Elysia marginata]|uniref:Endonuclease-reverse transcriptase n=1 Tax=Elysia marginata TaxID=1093978 RepID=A0AAV4EIX0_9GAST|nr:endonuclease-reverse transcriptase [Elysia marginata]
MLRISWTEKKSNETVLIEANSRGSLIKTIRKRQATFLGHVMRREKLEHLITTGKLVGKRGRGKQGEKRLDGLKRCMGFGSSTETMTAMGHRELWRNMIADASKHGTG